MFPCLLVRTASRAGCPSREAAVSAAGATAELLMGTEMLRDFIVRLRLLRNVLALMPSWVQRPVQPERQRQRGAPPVPCPQVYS